MTAGRTPLIGIVGAAGAVGRAAVMALHRLGDTELRLGGRSREALEQLALGLPGAHVVVVDLFDAAGLASFCRGCEVVLNCAGPAHEVGDRVAGAAFAAGADYVDAAGDDVLLQQVAQRRPPRAAAIEQSWPDPARSWPDPARSWQEPARAWPRRPRAQRTALVSAGMMPGLTALLPRYLAQTAPGRPRALTGYVGGRDRFTVTAAADYFRGGSSFGAARMALRDGRRVTVAGPIPHEPPFFPEPGSAMAFLSTETERVCARLGIADVSWYSVFTGEHVSAVMGVPPAPALARTAVLDSLRSPVEAAAALARAAALDSFGRQTYQLIVLELVTSTHTKTLVLRGCGASELTGEFAALSAHAVASRRIPAGVGHAGEALDPAEAVARLRDSASVDDIVVLDGSAYETGSYVEEAV